MNRIADAVSDYRSRTGGFTLIEILIVVAIVAILASIAYPSYIDSVRKARRSDAKTTLMDTAQTLERCFTQFNAYNDAACPIASGVDIDSSDGFYTIAPVTAAATYSLTATPVAGDVQAGDTQCATFTLTNTGAMTATGTLGNDCWN